MQVLSMGRSVIVEPGWRQRRLSWGRRGVGWCVAGISIRFVAGRGV